MTKRAFSVLTLLLAVASRGSASGFLLREQSASGQGNAFAGASAGAQDLSTMFWNPAALSLYPGTQMSVGGSWIGIHMDLTGASGTRAPGFQPTDLPISGAADLPNAVSQPILPAFYAGCSVNDWISVGLAVNVPFGLVTNYPDSFVGRYHALRTDLKTYDIAPTLGLRVNSDWTLGLAFVARKAEATISSAVDFGAIGNQQTIPGFVPGKADTVSTLKGSAWAFGYKAGATWQASPDLRLGLGYQSAATLSVKGKVAFGTVPPPLNGTFVDGDGNAELNLPATASLGLVYDVNSAFSLQGEAAWTGWSRFKELRVTFPSSGMPDNVTDESWKDTWFFSLGVLWKVNDAWTLKAGLAHDDSPVDDLHRTPRIPDSTRTWLSVGAAWKVAKDTTLDFGYTRLLAPDVALDLRSGSTPAADNFYRGNLSGTYKVGANLLAAGLRHRF
jgi:long-chain fatty acid transport protein